jgi:hypothetical protein
VTAKVAKNAKNGNGFQNDNGNGEDGHARNSPVLRGGSFRCLFSILIPPLPFFASFALFAVPPAT